MTPPIKKYLSLLALIILLTAMPAKSTEAVTAAPLLMAPHGLALSEIKITGDEFIIIQNNGGQAIDDLSQYWLEDYNNFNPLASGVNNTSQQLPPLPLGIGQTLQLSASPRITCGAAMTGKLNLSLTDSSGFLEIVQSSQSASGTVEQRVSDLVSWSSGSNGQIQNLPSSTKAPQALYYRYSPTSTTYSWQLAELNQPDNCLLKVTLSAGTTAQMVSTTPISLGSDIPATIISFESDESTAEDTDPATTQSVPQISELLPNPVGSGTDATNEFIELYNGDNLAFDLSGFRLQVGTTSLHSYIFPAGSSINAKSFLALFSADTGLSLSNSGGQVKLFNTTNLLVSASDMYGTAKDGQSYAIANGQWYWTPTPTPGSANVITQSASQSAASVAKSATTVKKTAIKTTTSKTIKAKATKSPKTKTTKKAKAKKIAAKPSSYSSASSEATALKVRPIHSGVIALIVVAALLYGAYEYRHDLANKGHQLRRFFTDGRAPRQ